MEINNHVPVEYTLTEAWHMSGVYQDDSDWAKDSKLFAWLDKRKHRCITYDAGSYSAEIDQAVADGVEVIILKGK